jgi:hypothetical protein
MVFDAVIDGAPHSFGVSGKLRHSDMVMYDRETETWWQQATGEAIVGELTGTPPDPAAGLDGKLGRVHRPATPTGWSWTSPTGAAPTAPIPTPATTVAPAVPLQGEDPPHGIPPLARVVRVENRAWTFERLRAEGEIREAGVTLSWTPGQASALDARDIAPRPRRRHRPRPRRGRPRPAPRHPLRLRLPRPLPRRRMDGRETCRLRPRRRRRRPPSRTGRRDGRACSPAGPACSSSR